VFVQLNVVPEEEGRVVHHRVVVFVQRQRAFEDLLGFVDLTLRLVEQALEMHDVRVVRMGVLFEQQFHAGDLLRGQVVLLEERVQLLVDVVEYEHVIRIDRADVVAHFASVADHVRKDFVGIQVQLVDEMTQVDVRAETDRIHRVVELRGGGGGHQIGLAAGQQTVVLHGNHVHRLLLHRVLVRRLPQEHDVPGSVLIHAFDERRQLRDQRGGEHDVVLEHQMVVRLVALARHANRLPVFEGVRKHVRVQRTGQFRVELIVVLRVLLRLNQLPSHLHVYAIGIVLIDDFHGNLVRREREDGVHTLLTLLQLSPVDDINIEVHGAYRNEHKKFDERTKLK